MIGTVESVDVRLLCIPVSARPAVRTLCAAEIYIIIDGGVARLCSLSLS